MVNYKPPANTEANTIKPVNNKHISDIIELIRAHSTPSLPQLVFQTTEQ